MKRTRPTYIEVKLKKGSEADVRKIFAENINKIGTQGDVENAANEQGVSLGSFLWRLYEQAEREVARAAGLKENHLALLQESGLNLSLFPSRKRSTIH